jgi:YesN/AraC family two-component response regulator
MLFQQRFRKEIKSGKLEFQFAISGESALEYLQNGGCQKIAQIFSDINMPDMNGIELLKQIKEKYQNLKVSMITAYEDENYLKEAQAHGCDEYFTKPLNFDSLKQKIFETG